MKRVSINGLAVLAVSAGCLMGAGDGLAMEAAAKFAVDLRSGPDAGSNVVDQLADTERVNVTQCTPTNFCFVEHTGPDGWVSAADLGPTNTDGLDQGIVQQGSGDYADCSFGFVVGEGAPILKVSCDAAAATKPIKAVEPRNDQPDAPEVAATFSAGVIMLPQMLTADLDAGSIGGGGADIWYQATATQKFLQPQRGARLALGDGTDRGFKGCWGEDFTNGGIALEDAQVGTHICVKTSDGRISQVEVSGFDGTTLKLGYTTWAN